MGWDDGMMGVLLLGYMELTFFWGCLMLGNVNCGFVFISESWGYVPDTLVFFSHVIFIFCVLFVF